MQNSHDSSTAQAISTTPSIRKEGARESASGVRFDLEWSRSGQVDKRLGNLELLRALECHDMRRGAPWSKGDARSLRDAVDRSWGLNELQNQRWQGTASWIRPLLPQRRSFAYVDFLAAVISAYRVGTVGVLVSQTAFSGLLSVSAQTLRRWTGEMEALGLISTVQTWQPDPARPNGRMFGPLLYRVGPVLLNDAAILEGAPASSHRSAAAGQARIDASAARRELRREQSDRIAKLYEDRTARRTSRERCQPLAKAWAGIANDVEASSEVEKPEAEATAQERSPETILLEPAHKVLPIPPPPSGVIPTPSRREVEKSKRPRDSRRVTVRYAPSRCSGRAPLTEASINAGRARFAGAPGGSKNPKSSVAGQRHSPAPKKYTPAPAFRAEPTVTVSPEERAKMDNLARETLAKLQSQRDPEAVRDEAWRAAKIREERRIAEMNASEREERISAVLETCRKISESPRPDFFCAPKSSELLSGIPDIFDPYADQRKSLRVSKPSAFVPAVDASSGAPLAELQTGRSFLAGLKLPSFEGKK